MPAPLDLKAVLEELERTAPGASRVLLLAAATPGRRVVWPWVEGLVPDLTDDARAAVRHLLEVRGLVRDGADPPGATGTLGQEVAEAATPLLTDENATIDRYVIDRAEQVAEDQAGFPEPWEVDALLGVLSRPLGSNPGLVTQIPQFLRSVALAAPEDTRLRTILLDACIKLAGTGTRAEAEANARLADALHTTDPPTALTHYRRALEITRDLAEQHPDDPQLKRDTSVALNDVSRMLRDTDPTQALAHYRESLEITEFLAEHYRDDSGRIRLDLCIALRNVAEMLTPIDPEQALALYRRSLDVNTELADAWPHNLSLRHGLASSLNDIATLLSGTDPEQALGYYQRALGILRELAAAQPGNLQAAHDLAAALSNVTILLEHTDPEQALSLSKECLGLRRAAVAAHPGNIRAARDLAIALVQLGGITALSDPVRAAEHYLEALAIQQSIAEALPGSLRALWDLGTTSARLGELISPEHPEHRAMWRRAATSFRAALAIQPGHPGLARLSHLSARSYADCDPVDRDDWLAHAAALAQRFGFEE